MMDQAMNNTEEKADHQKTSDGLINVFEHILKNSEDIIMTADLDGKVVFITPNVVSLLKCQPSDLMGRHIHAFYEGQKETARMLTEKLLAEKEIRSLEITMRRADGETFPASLSAFLLTDQDGHASRITFIYKDITDKKRLEEQLLQARKMEAIGTLAGGIAHDFNNLLMGIHGYTSLMLLNMSPGHPHWEMLKSIEEQVQSGADLTRKLLGFAQGEKYEAKPTDMNDLVKKSAKIFGRTKKEIRLHGRYDKNLLTTEVDASQMEHVLLNLYINAWQAMPEGGDIYLETINVRLDELCTQPYNVPAGSYVKVSVSDSGVGMDEETKRRIFEPFFTTKERCRGTGLGLASAYGIVKSHGGFIKVHSEKGKGTTVTFFLPASHGIVVKQTLSHVRLQKGSETILVIDDEEVTLHVTKEMLASLGYLALGAGSGREGVEIYRQNTADIAIVILDMIMPGMSGFETFEALKQINPDVNILLSSGYSLNGQAKAIIDRGCRGFIQKPFGIEELSAKIWASLQDIAATTYGIAL
ncbi:MAG: ATP-binding protein [Syntrophales bacterium]